MIKTNKKKTTKKKASSKKANPKCRTIKVRRKISMSKGKRSRILQIRRKVCNPRDTILNKLNGLLHTQVIIKGDGRDKIGILKKNYSSTSIHRNAYLGENSFKVISNDGKKVIYDFDASVVDYIDDINDSIIHIES